MRKAQGLYPPDPCLALPCCVVSCLALPCLVLSCLEGFRGKPVKVEKGARDGTNFFARTFMTHASMSSAEAAGGGH